MVIDEHKRLIPKSKTSKERNEEFDALYYITVHVEFMGLDAIKKDKKERNTIYEKLDEDWYKIETSKGAITTTFVKRCTNINTNSTNQFTIDEINQSKHKYQAITKQTNDYFNDLVKKHSESKEKPRLVISISKYYPEVFPPEK